MELASPAARRRQSGRLIKADIAAVFTCGAYRMLTLHLQRQAVHAAPHVGAADRINAILSGAGHNFRLLLKWLRLLLRLILETMLAMSRERQAIAAPA